MLSKRLPLFMNILLATKISKSHPRRLISSTAPKLKVVPSNLKGKTSSNEWMTRHLNDPYGKLARFNHYRCRSAFKLIEIDEKYSILRPGQVIVDCGAAPGSWTQVVVKKLKLDSLNIEPSHGAAIAIDLKQIFPIKGATCLQLDFTKPETQKQVTSHLPNGEADVILSDMAPNATGVKDIDSIQITTLVYSALQFCTKVLKTDGTFLCKIWNSSQVSNVIKNMELLFSNVKIVKPKASYSDSSELFLLCKGYKGHPSTTVN